MENLPKEKETAHICWKNHTIPADKMNEWGYPSSEHYVFAGNHATNRNIRTRVDEKTDEEHKVLVVSHITWWNPVTKEKTATQLRKERKHAIDNADAVSYAKAFTKAQLSRQCLDLGLPHTGTKEVLATRIIAQSNARGEEE